MKACDYVAQRCPQVNGIQVASTSVVVNTAAPSLVTLPSSFAKVETVYIAASGGTANAALGFVPPGMVSCILFLGCYCVLLKGCKPD